MFFCRGQALEPTGCYSSLTPKLFRLNFLEHYHLSRLLSQKMRPLSTHPLLSVYKHAKKIGKIRVSMPSRAYTSFLPNRSGYRHLIKSGGFNALSGLYLISTFWRVQRFTHHLCRFQCPLGLIPHFYPDKGWYPSVGNYKSFQCPLGLIPHFYTKSTGGMTVELSVSMPSRAYTSFLRQMSQQ